MSSLPVDGSQARGPDGDVPRTIDARKETPSIGGEQVPSSSIGDSLGKLATIAASRGEMGDRLRPSYGLERIAVTAAETPA